VFDWYGQAERVAAIGTCEHGSYHVLTDYSGVALLERAGRAPANWSAPPSTTPPCRCSTTAPAIR
jgi:hypothetical protein